MGLLMKPLVSKIFSIMQAVILAGGLGTRLRPLTYKIPKPMVEINGKPFLEYLIIYLKEQNLKNILICTGYMSEKISSYFEDGSAFGVHIQFSNEKNPIGTGGALKNAEMFLNNNFILLNGDTFMPLDYNQLIGYYKKSNGKNVIVVNKNKKFQGNIGIGDDKTVMGYDKIKKRYGYDDCGVQVFGKKILELIQKNKNVSLENEIFPLLIKKKELIAFETKADFFDLGTLDSMNKFKIYVQNL